MTTVTNETARGQWFRRTPDQQYLIFDRYCCAGRDSWFRVPSDSIDAWTVSALGGLDEVLVLHSDVERVEFEHGTPVTITAARGTRSAYHAPGPATVGDRYDVTQDGMVEAWHLDSGDCHDWLYPIDFTIDTVPGPISVGDRVRYTGNSSGYFVLPRAIGHTGRVTRMDGQVEVEWDEPAPGSLSAVYAHNLTRIGDDTEPVVEAATLTVTKEEHDRIVANLQAEVARLTTWQQQANADASDLNDRLNEEAENRGWCGDYERILNAVPLRVLEFKGREKEWTATREVQVTVSVTQYGAYTGTSDDPDEDDFTWSAIDTSDVQREVGFGNFTVTDDTDDFESSQDN